jgi:antitoxin component of MazEF toxin-antitoxin module
MSERVLIRVSKLYRSGNGLSVHIPRRVLELTGLKCGDEVLMYVYPSDGSILLKPHKKPSIGSVPLL